MRLKPSVARVNLVADAVSACVHAAIPTLGSDLVFTAIDADLTDGAITLHGVTEFAAAWMLDQYQACRRDDAHSGAGLRSAVWARRSQGKARGRAGVSHKKYAHRLQQERRIWLRCR